MKHLNNNNEINIGIIGLGYVGLPLAVSFANYFETFGFDIDKQRVDELKQKKDSTLEVSVQEFNQAKFLTITDELAQLKNCNIYIITVPTPIDHKNKPDLSLLKKATINLAPLIKKDDILVYESTVYPGATQEYCLSILQKKLRSLNKNLEYNQDYFFGYSPERINPGDQDKRLKDITKIVAGSTDKVRDFLAQLYAQIIQAGIHKADSIEIAEAAKAIENAQRDINIAFMNELAMFFNKIDIPTHKVLEAAGSKWNFLKFEPGLVGGHCIGVDPYYLVHKAKEVGFKCQSIISGRKINNNLPFYVAQRVVDLLKKNKLFSPQAKILIMGISFKENCPDCRNSKVYDIIDYLKKKKLNLSYYDPIAQSEIIKGVKRLYTLEGIENEYAGVIFAVKHKEFLKLSKQQIFNLVENKGAKKGIIYDIKNMLPEGIATETL